MALSSDWFAGTGFMGSMKNYEEALIILAGAPMDMTCCSRPGARFGPQRIREVSDMLEDYSVAMDGCISEARMYDMGDLSLPQGDAVASLDIIGKAAEKIYRDKKSPFFIGGEHLISVPAVREAYRVYGKELILIHIDAHADLRDEYQGVRFSHAAVVRRIMDFMPPENIYQLGIRSGTKEEFLTAQSSTNMYRFEVLNPLKELIEKFGKSPVYVTIDIDVADPAFANGTGTPEPGGITSSELLNAACELKRLNIKGADVVEVSPQYDLSDRTVILAAKIIREIVIGMSGK